MLYSIGKNKNTRLSWSLMNSIQLFMVQEKVCKLKQPPLNLINMLEWIHLMMCYRLSRPNKESAGLSKNAADIKESLNTVFLVPLNIFCSFFVLYKYCFGNFSPAAQSCYEWTKVLLTSIKMPSSPETKYLRSLWKPKVKFAVNIGQLKLVIPVKICTLAQAMRFI